MKVLFIGGTGLISTAASELAVRSGIDLFMLNRGKRNEFVPAGATTLHGDIDDAPKVRSLLKDHHFDAVVERALAELPVSMSLAMPLVRKEGLFLAYQSAPSGGCDIAYRLPHEEKDRYLAIFRKTLEP